MFTYKYWFQIVLVKKYFLVQGILVSKKQGQILAVGELMLTRQISPGQMSAGKMSPR